MRIRNILFIVILFVVSACQQPVKEIFLVQKGNAGNTQIEGVEKSDQGFLTTDGDFHISADTVIYGDEIDVNVKLSSGSEPKEVSII